jgi:hypothetical protein
VRLSNGYQTYPSCKFVFFFSPAGRSYSLCAFAPLRPLRLSLLSFRPQALFYLGVLVVHQSSAALIERHPLFLYGEFRHFLRSIVAKSGHSSVPVGFDAVGCLPRGIARSGQDARGPGEVPFLPILQPH